MVNNVKSLMQELMPTIHFLGLCVDVEYVLELGGVPSVGCSVLVEDSVPGDERLIKFKVIMYW